MRQHSKAVILGGALVLVAAPQALAHHSGSGGLYDSLFPTPILSGCQQGVGHFCQTDNANVTYFAQTSISATKRTLIGNVLASQYAPTDLTLQYQNPPVYDGGGQTDLVYRIYAGVPVELIGRVWCDSRVSSVLCDQQIVEFRQDSGIDVVSACHETGHGIGLTHPANASDGISSPPTNDPEFRCMLTPYSGYTTLGPHNVDQINRNW